MSKCIVFPYCGVDNLLKVSDPSFAAACEQHDISRYYNCEIDIANDAEIQNDRLWLTCPTYIGRHPHTHRRYQQSTQYIIQ